MSLLRRPQTASESPEQRRQKAQLRAQRMERAREARAATRMMEPPELARGLYVGVFLVLVGVVSFLSTDIGQETVKKGGKTVSAQVVVPPHNSTSLVLIALAVASAASIYWRRRLVTGILFMLAAAIGFGTPLPKGYQDGTWLAFGIPAAYVLWMLVFRMNKQQKAWIAEHAPSSNGSVATKSGRNSSRRSSSAGASAARGAKRGKLSQQTTSSGRALPPPSGRYTPPKAKAAERK